MVEFVTNCVVNVNSSFTLAYLNSRHHPVIHTMLLAGKEANEFKARVS